MQTIRASQFVVASAVLVLACGGAGKGGDAKITNVQENSAPAGFVEGRLVNAADGTPVVKAQVSTFADGPVNILTDSDGLYRLGPIPVGTYTVAYEASGFLRRSFDISLQQNGNGLYPVGNTVVTRDVDMSKPDAVIAGQVLTNTDQIAKNATLYLDLRPNGFDLVATSKADANGKFRFEGMPGSAFGTYITVSVAPYDENADDIPDYNATSRSFVLFPGFTTYNTITVYALGVQLVTSNISDGDLLPAEAITLTFNGQILTNESTITLFRNSGGIQVGASLVWDASSSTATLTPVGGNLVEGQMYYVLYNVKALNGAATNSSIIFTARPSTGTEPPGTVVNFRVIIPAKPEYDSGLINLTVAWDQLPNSAGYRVYGKDAATASAYLLLTSVSSTFTTSAGLNLSLFDSASGDAFTTPLGHHNKVKLAVVAIDRSGNEASLLTAATLELSDNVNPTVSFASQILGSANNLAGGAAATVMIQVTFSELMATDTVPQITLPNAATSAIWAWVSSNRGNFTITVPAGVDGRGTVSVSGGKDTSDNPQTVAFTSPLQ